MITEAEQDLERIRFTSDKLLDVKYREGNKEHGGDLMTMTVREYITNALDENTDQRVYLLKALEALNDKN